MNKKISLGIAISLMAIVATIAIALTYSIAINVFENRMSAITNRQSTSDLINEIDNKVRQKYLGKIDELGLRDGVAQGYINGLSDDNCAYFSESEWELESDRAAGYDFGFGMSVSPTSDGNILVYRVTSGSPAATGFTAGDVITQIGDDAVAEIGYSAAIERLSAATASVQLKVKNSSNVRELTKGRFTIVSVDYRQMDEIGYIAIWDFNAKTSDQFNAALAKLQQNDIKALIIDLRDCDGGSFADACSVLDTLLPAGRLLLLDTGSGEPDTVYTSDARSVSLPMSVLIDSHTGGAAEFFASAIADYDKLGSSLVGTATAGRMAYTEDFVLSDGSALRLTTGSWQSPVSRAVTDGAVRPDFEVRLTSYQEENLWVLSANDDPQLQTALEILSSAIDDGSATSSSDAVENQ